ncbi:MazG nucleotide pyrophosphohydrolase domain-containing protein [Haloprofundus halobius]|uniref:MazG nucleotide pyrophosphohydrolase domain-containing protein n=1 Tax=Haloprofundus halobius TaxID=2876194 RepID=UPI001CCCD867|nr:MazG nucleotide pyrophosphohydrolase domain-containing protein [Haloprofundus halobius]
MQEQQRVATFLEEHDMQTEPEFRLLALVSELGELAKDVNESSDYGSNRWTIDVKRDEVGDVLVALLGFADSLDIDASEALDDALSKYETRIEETGDPSSE